MDRQIITFEANEQTLIKTGGLDNYSSNKVSYIEAHFALGQNWAGYDSVRAVWSTRYECISTVLDTEGICVVPYEVLKWKDKVIVNLVGSISENDVLTDRITTYPIKALEVDADAKVCGSNTQPITPSEYEQFVEAVKADADRAEEAKEDARVYAGNALSSAQNALISETNASASEDNAKASELNAETYKNQAQTYAQNAHNSAISAENAKDEAEDARDTILGMRAEATTLPEGSSATASYNDGVMSFGIPKGDTGARGATGETGATPQLSIGTVTTTTEPSVTITGTAENPVLNFGLVKGDKGDTGEVSTEQLNEAIENGVTAGTNGLVSDSKITEKVPYQFRPTAGGVRVGNIAYDKLVGGTVAWNQLLPDFTTDAWATSQYATISNGEVAVQPTSTWTVTQTADNVSVISGHKYYISVVGRLASSGTNVEIGTGLIGNTTTVGVLTTTTNTTLSKVVSVTNSGTGLLNLANRVGVAGYYMSKPQLIDLTQMFGSTIADYIYGLEQANAGAGVAWFRKLFPKPYYAYNAGELKSVSGVSAHNMTGFNQWDEQWENGYYNRATGEKAGNSDTTYIRSKNFIPCLPNTTYYFKSPTAHADNNTYYAVLFYDADKNFISAGNNLVLYPTKTAPSNACYMTFYVQVGTSGATYKNDICINLSWDGERNGEYEPYVKHSYPLDSDLTLRGIPKLDSSNNLYYDGDTYESDGTVTRKYGIVDLGSLAYGYNSSYGFYCSTPSYMKNPNDNYAYANVVCSKYRTQTVAHIVDGSTDKAIAVGAYIYISDSAYTDATDFKTAMSGVYLVYELATPTTETADPYTSPQVVDRYGTEEYVSTSIVPVGHITEYSQDLKGKIEQLPWDFSTLIAPTETSNKASRNYTSGSLLIMNNILYKATANIQNGGTITPNSNVIATTLAEVIASL